MVVCPWCATTLDRGHCTGCGRELDPDWRICPWCRTPAEVSQVPPSPSLRGQAGDGGDHSGSRPVSATRRETTSVRDVGTDGAKARADAHPATRGSR